MPNYIPSEKKDIQAMLEKVGAKKMTDLYKDVPDSMILKQPLNLPEGKSEMQVSSEISAMAAKNKVYTSIFRGAGAYNHYIPAIVKNVTSKDEFVTAYTPYQAEISQGTLQSIFEFQTMICSLLDMDVSNASVYDGGTAAAEAVAMVKERNKSKVLVSSLVNPQYRKVIDTYTFGSETPIETIPCKDGKTDFDAFCEMLTPDVAGVYIQQPNFAGQIEDVEKFVEKAHANGVKVILGIDPIYAAVGTTPGEYGVDIAIGDGQQLGMPLSFGGPYLGFMTTTDALVRKLPGRIVGQTTDANGNRAFVLTLQAREQHIRREKASSNICSNQALCALTAGVYMTAMGKDGLANVANQSYAKAHYLKDRLCEIGFSVPHSGEFFNEFVTDCPIDAKALAKKLSKYGILAGLPLSCGKNRMLWCATECNTKAEIDNLIEKIKEVLSK